MRDNASEHMTDRATQEELQAATNAILRAHATSDEAKALVVRLAAMVDEHTRTRRSGCSKKQNVVRTHHTDDQSIRWKQFRD